MKLSDARLGHPKLAHLLLRPSEENLEIIKNWLPSERWVPREVRGTDERVHLATYPSLE